MAFKNVNAAITTTLDLNSSGSEVTELQTYLARNSGIYPSGLITGFFGPLTQAAVQRFQASQGIITNGTPETTGYGRVGPQTMARINSLLGSNTGGQVSGDMAPVLSGTSIQLGRTSATLSWSSNEITQGQVYYDSAPLRSDEATGPRQLPYVSGIYATDGGGQTSHSLTIQNLQPNTLYYYLTRGVDNSGNMSMTWPSTFRTNQ